MGINPRRIAVSGGIILVLASWRAPATAQEFSFPIATPRIDRVSAVLPAPGGDVPIELQLGYDSRGNLACAGDCSVDGTPVAVKGKVKSRGGSVSYQLKLTGSDAGGRTSVSIAGILDSGSARCVYKGPKGKASVPECAITVTASLNLTGTVHICPEIDCKGKIGGIAAIRSGFGNDEGAPAVLKGKVDLRKQSLKFIVKQGKGKISFKGNLVGSRFSGMAGIKLPPEKGSAPVAIDADIFRIPEDCPEPPRVLIAVIDSGIDALHPDLACQIVPGLDFVDGDRDPDDFIGHGTEMAGIIAANGEVIGECPQCRILPLKVANSIGAVDHDRLAAAIEFAAANGAGVIYIGSGSIGISGSVIAAIAAAEARGAVVVAPAGSREGTHTLFPAALPAVVSVVGVDDDGRFLSTATTSGRETVAAPGKDVTTTSARGGAVTRTGSSAAAARVAGIAGRILSENPGLAPAQVRQIIRHGIDLLPYPGWYDVFEYGVIDREKALARASSDLLDAAVARLEVFPRRPLGGQPARALVRVVNRGNVPTGPLLLETTWNGNPVEPAAEIASLDLEEAVEIEIDLPPGAAGSRANVVAAIAPLPGESATANNAAAASIDYSDAPIHDVDVIAGELSEPVIETGELSIPIAIRNRGNQDEPVTLEVFAGEVPVGSRMFDLAAGERVETSASWPIVEETTEKFQAIRVVASIPGDDADPENNEWFLEVSVGLRDSPGTLQYSDTPSPVDVVLDAPWRTIRDYVPVLVFLPDFPPGGGRLLEEAEVRNFDGVNGLVGSRIFQDFRSLFDRNGVRLLDTYPPGAVIIDPDGFARGGLRFNETFSDFWHYIVRLPTAVIGEGNRLGAPGLHFLHASAVWSRKVFSFPRGFIYPNTVNSRVLRVQIDGLPLPKFDDADHYFDAHVHTIAEQTIWQDLLDAPLKNFGGPLAMLLDASYAIGLVDVPFNNGNWTAFKDKLVITDHNVFYSQETHMVLKSSLVGVSRLPTPISKPSAPGYGPTRNTNGAAGEGSWYRTNLGRFAGEEVALASGTNQPIKKLSHHLLAYDTAHIEGPWHGGELLISLTKNPNNLQNVFLQMKAHNETGFGYAAHPCAENFVWPQEYFDQGIGAPPFNSKGGPLVNSSGNEFIFKGSQVWNQKHEEVAAANGTLDFPETLPIMNPFAGGPPEQRFRPDTAWLDGLNLSLRTYRSQVRQNLVYAFREAPLEKFIRKLYAVAGSDAHGDFNYMDDILGSKVELVRAITGISGFGGSMTSTAYARMRTYVLAHDRPAAGDPDATAQEAYREGNSVMTDGPICRFILDSDGYHNPEADPRWHDARSLYENPEGRIGGLGPFDGGRTVLVPSRAEEDPPVTNVYIETEWLRSVTPGTGDIINYEFTMIQPGGDEEFLLPAGAPAVIRRQSFPRTIGRMAAVMIRAESRDGGVAKHERCITNPVWAAPVPIEVIHPGSCPIPKENLKVIFHFPITIIASGGAYIAPLDAEGNSIDELEIQLTPDPGFEEEGGVFNGKFTATNESDIVCPEDLWDADNHAPPAEGLDIRSYALYLKSPLELHGNRLNDIGRTFTVAIDTTPLIAIGGSFTAIPGTVNRIDLRTGDSFPQGSTYELVQPPSLHEDLFQWNGDGTFDVAPLTFGPPITFTYRIRSGENASDVATVIIQVDPRRLYQLPPRTDPETMEAFVEVPCLILDNLHYPIYQFTLSNNPGDACQPPHWHASRTVFPLERPSSGRNDPDPPRCGFGRYRDVPQAIVPFPADAWQDFLLAHIPPL